MIIVGIKHGWKHDTRVMVEISWDTMKEVCSVVLNQVSMDIKDQEERLRLRLKILETEIAFLNQKLLLSEKYGLVFPEPRKTRGNKNDRSE